MIKYIAYYMHDLPHAIISTISALEIEYGNSSTAPSRILSFLSKVGGRAIIAYVDDEYIGHYVYAPAARWLAVPMELTPIKNKLQSNGIDLAKCTVPIFCHLLTEYATEENYLEINKQRINDAKSNGYEFGIIGFNQRNEDSDACLQATWLQSKDNFALYANAPINPLGIQYQSKEIYLQNYM